jgi:hypothetical protein
MTVARRSDDGGSQSHRSTWRALVEIAQFVSRHSAVLISPRDYDRLRGVGVADFEAFCNQVADKAAALGLTPEKLDALLQADA